MKKLIPILTIIAFFLFNIQLANAQCTPDPDCTDPEGDGEYCPTQFPNAVEDEAYDATLTIIAPISSQGIDLHHVDLLSITNIPPGMDYQCQDDDCTFWPGVAKCVSVSGTPEIGSWGTYNLHMTLEVFIDVSGFPVSIGVVEDSSSYVTIESQLHADFVIDGLDEGFLCNNYPFTVYYSGDATEAATYNWNFGENIEVQSGEGQGPYIVSYEFGYAGMDSISLEVSEGPYTSPIFQEVYYTDICGSTNENISDDLSIYPNPVVNNLFVNIGSSKNANAIIYDLTGKEVYQVILENNSNTLDLSQLQRGIYFLNIVGTQNSVTKKFIKK